MAKELTEQEKLNDEVARFPFECLYEDTGESGLYKMFVFVNFALLLVNLVVLIFLKK